MFQFIHAADIHLDSPLRGLSRYEGAPVEQIKLATRRALEQLVDLALQEKVAFVLFAGDLYDGDWRDYNTGLFFLGQMQRLRDAEIRVFLIAGNHDAANKMTKQLRFLDNMTMLSHEKPQTVVLDELGVAVHGQSFAEQAVKEDLSQHYPQAAKGLFNIGMLHTCFTGVEGHERYAPCKLDVLCSKQYDYWALGHIHKRGVLQEKPFVVFPGNVQGRHIRETGEKGCYLVTVNDRREASVEFQRLDVFRWELCDVAAHDAQDEADVFEKISERLRQLKDSENNPTAVRLHVRGPRKAVERLAADAERCVNEIRGIAIGEMWVEKVKVSPIESTTIDWGDDGPMGELSAVLQELSGDEPLLKKTLEEMSDVAKLMDKAKGELSDGPEPLSVDDPVWLREVLAQVGPLLTHRLLHGEPRA